MAVRRWLSSVATQDRSAIDIANELQYLQEKYRAHIERHRIKATRGALETVVVATAEVIECLAKLKLSTLAKKSFAISRTQIEMMEAEATAPGREIAYLVKTRERSGSRDS